MLGKGATLFDQHVFEQEGDDIGKADGLFLLVREAGDLATLDDRITTGCGDVFQNGGRVADKRDGFVRGEGILDNGLRNRALRKVP